MSTLRQPLLSSATRRMPIEIVRVILTTQVIFHHCLTTYTSIINKWYSNPTSSDFANQVILAIIFLEQSYFMSLFFFFAGLFMENSFRKRGISAFFTNKLARLGIPTIAFFLVISPITVTVSVIISKTFTGSQLFSFGPLWFNEALLIFIAVYTGWRYITKSMPPAPFPTAQPISIRTFYVLAVITGILNLLVRTKCPVGTMMPGTEFQLAFFAEYIIAFWLGIRAGRRKWIRSLQHRHLRIALSAIGASLLIMLVAVVVAGGVYPFLQSSGLWSYLWDIVEQVLGWSIALAILVWAGRTSWRPPKMATLSRASYATYVLHRPLVAWVGALVEYTHWSTSGWGTFCKCALCILISVPVSWAVAHWSLRIPSVARIL
eukprot:gnl/Dysnectes_brevis/1480_a1674_1222.p1 GENE.gnl/Dysnectes_brevis/1480_a1674_1222~~gnl/Dysnectes_brevis/1480_a1674_1222.p1  ORF type:complete len:376 (+),score=129.89 gnl/Dysnectes_brevis/1480_a1674_1222:1323-2450(+)